MIRQPADHGARAVDHLAPEIMISSPANASEPRFAAGGILSRYQADPGGELAPRSEMTAVVDGCDQRGGDDRADARQDSEPAARGV